MMQVKLLPRDQELVLARELDQVLVQERDQELVLHWFPRTCS